MYYFFFSYSRSDNSEFLKGFFSDLQNIIKEKLGLEGDVGFIDQTGNEPGDHWEAKLEQALACSRVFVAVATASYARKEYCGKEWAAFEDRVTRYSANRPDVAVAPLIIPVLWIPPSERAPFPDVIRGRHYHLGDPQSKINQRGIRYVFKNKARFGLEYDDFMDALAERVIGLAHEHAGIDAIQDVPGLSSIKSPFETDADAANALNAPPARQRGLKWVHFVYGAGSPNQARQAGRDSVSAYGDRGGAEWQPFLPDERTIGSLAQQVASSDQLGMIACELPLSDDLPDKVRQLEGERQLVVVLLDYWAAKIPAFEAALEDFDRSNYINCSVLVLRNRGDSDTKDHWQELNDKLHNALFYRFKNGNELFLRTGIDEEQRFREQLEDVLTRLRAEVINRSDPNLVNLPQSGTRPSVSGPRGDHD